MQIKNHPWFNQVNQKLDKGLIITREPIQIDYDAISLCMNNYFTLNQITQDELIENLKRNCHNEYTCLYYLVLRERAEEPVSNQSRNKLNKNLNDFYSKSYNPQVKNVEIDLNKNDQSKSPSINAKIKPSKTNNKFFKLN